MAQCDAIQGAKPFRNPGVRALANKRQCRRDGVIPVAGNGPVCHQHHRHGFVSWSQTRGCAAPTREQMIAERMQAVLDGEAA